MNPFSRLGEEQHEQIRKYLRFFRQKREAIVRTVAREFEDAKADRFNEDVYSREDMEEFCDFLKSCITTQVNADLSAVINMGALSVCQLLESAQDKGTVLSLETSAVENQQLLEAVEKMSLDALPKTQAVKAGMLVRLFVFASQSSNLSPYTPSHPFSPQTSMRQEAKAMKETAEQLQEEKQRLNEEVQFLRGRVSMLERQASAAGGESKQRDTADNDSGSAARIRVLEVELREAREEAERRVSDTVQFQQMKKLMQSQSQNIADLRRRLLRWEPDDAKGE